MISVDDRDRALNILGVLFEKELLEGDLEIITIYVQGGEIAVGATMSLEDTMQVIESMIGKEPVNREKRRGSDAN